MIARYLEARRVRRWAQLVERLEQLGADARRAAPLPPRAD